MEGSSAANIVVVINALDESGAEVTRATILRVLATCDAELPSNPSDSFDFSAARGYPGGIERHSACLYQVTRQC